LPATSKAQGITTAIGDPTYFGTDAAVPIMPKLTCNPTSNLGTNQVLNGSCFAAPAVGTPGRPSLPLHARSVVFQQRSVRL
jgi:hypothetical protein